MFLVVSGLREIITTLIVCLLIIEGDVVGAGFVDRVVVLDRELPAPPHQGMDFIRCDIPSSAEVDAAIAAVLAASGKIDILVNNAGINVEGSIESLTDEARPRCFDIHVAVTVRTCRAVIPAMKKQRYGRTVNAASFASMMRS